MSDSLLIGARYLKVSEIEQLYLLLEQSNQLDMSWQYHREEEGCTAIIIDVDSQQAHTEWEQSQARSNGSIMIAYTRYPERYKQSDYVIPKPFHKAALERVLANVEKHLTENRRDTLAANVLLLTPPNGNKGRARIIDVLLQHRRQILLFENEVRIVLDCAQHKSFGLTSYADALVWLQETCADCTITVLPSDQINLYTESLPEYDLTQAVWTVIMSEAWNNAIPACPSDVYLQLNKWPDFNQLPHQTVHLTAAAILAKNRSTAQDLAQAVHTSTKQLQPFINACLALGYITPVKEPLLFWQDAHYKPRGMLRRVYGLFAPKQGSQSFI